MNETVQPEIQYVTPNHAVPNNILSINGLFIRQRVDIDPLYDGPRHDPDAGFFEMSQAQIEAANRVVDGSKDPEPVIARLMKCKGFRRIEPGAISHGIALVEKESTPGQKVPEHYQFALPKDAMYGKLGELAVGCEAPLSWMYPAILGMYAGTGINITDPHPQVFPTLYVLLVGPIGVGKSVVLERGPQQLGLQEGDIQDPPVSDRGLISIFRDLAGLDRREHPTVTVPGLILADEAIEMIKKMAIQGSTLAQKMCQAWSMDRMSAVDKFGTWDALARFSYVGNFKCDDPDEFSSTAEALGGFTDRCVIAPGPDSWRPKWGWKPTPPDACSDDFNPDRAAKMGYQAYPRPKGVVNISAAIFKMAEDWRDEQERNCVRPGRLTEIALRVALISASANGDSTVTEAGMQAALRFAEWQMDVRRVYVAGIGQNDDAKIANLLMKAFEEMAKAHKEGKSKIVLGKPITDTAGWVSGRLLRLSKPYWWQKYGPTAMNRAMESMRRMGIIEQLYTAPTHPLNGGSDLKAKPQPQNKWRLKYDDDLSN